MCEAVFRKEKHKIFIKNAGVEADEENEEISSVEYTYAGNRRDDCTYDANGNLTASGDGWTVTYNLLNLPASAVKNAGTDDEQTVEWSYLADGTKIAAYVSPCVDVAVDTVAVDTFTYFKCFESFGHKKEPTDGTDAVYKRVF